LEDEDEDEEAFSNEVGVLSKLAYFESSILIARFRVVAVMALTPRGSLMLA
jgi:hypothetical protein